MTLVPELPRCLHSTFPWVFRVTLNTMCTGGPQLLNFRTTAAAHPLLGGVGGQPTSSKCIKPLQRVKRGPGTWGLSTHGVQSWGCIPSPETFTVASTASRSPTGPFGVCVGGSACSTLFPLLRLENLLSEHFAQQCYFQPSPKLHRATVYPFCLPIYYSDCPCFPRSPVNLLQINVDQEIIYCDCSSDLDSEKKRQSFPLIIVTTLILDVCWDFIEDLTL